VSEDEMFLFDNSEKLIWHCKYHKVNDLKYLERTLLMK